MKAASEEFQKVLQSTGQQVASNGPRLTLSREELDNMPVLGKFSACINSVPQACSDVHGLQRSHFQQISLI